MRKYIFLTLAAAALTSCSEDMMDRINEDHGNPPLETVNGKLQITDAIVSTAFSSSGDYAFYASIYNEQLFGTANNQLKNAEMRLISETAGSTTFNNAWNSVYANLLNLKIILGKCEEGGINEGMNDLRGMAELFSALNWGLLTDMHGDIPCSEALNGGNLKQPKLDKQEEVYTKIFSLLDAAIDDFGTAIAEGQDNVGQQDILYGGDCQAWLAAAHAMKARYKLHMALRDGNALGEALAEAQAAVGAGFNGIVFSGYDGNDISMNPYAAFQYSRDYLANSTTMRDLLIARNDPRLGIYINYYWQGEAVPDDVTGELPEPTCGTPGNADEASAAGGDLDAPKWITYSKEWYPMFPAASTHILSLSEVYFIIAEVQARQGADCTSALTSAIEAAFADASAFGTVGTTAADYVTSLTASLAADPLKEVMVQKYIAQGRDEQAETFNDLRRCKAMGKVCVEMTNPLNTQGGQNRLPLRMPYGNSGVSSNVNVRQAYGDGMYVFTEPVWIFGGTR